MEDLEESNAEPAASADAGRMTAFCASTALERPALLSLVVLPCRAVLFGCCGLEGAMRRRWVLWVGLVLAAVIAVVWLDPTRVLLGLVRNEAFYRGRPTSYWRAKVY